MLLILFARLEGGISPKVIQPSYPMLQAQMVLAHICIVVNSSSTELEWPLKLALKLATSSCLHRAHLIFIQPSLILDPDPSVLKYG